MDKKPTCPTCRKHRLALKQINFTTAVYLCKDKKCTYPLGHGWTYVQRWYEDVPPCNKKRHRPVKKKNDLLHELNDLLTGQHPLPDASFDELIEQEIEKVNRSGDADLSFEELLGLEIPADAGLPFDSNLEDLLDIAGMELQTSGGETNISHGKITEPEECNDGIENCGSFSLQTISTDVISEQDIFSICSLDANENIETETETSNSISLQSSSGKNSGQDTNIFYTQDENETIDSQSSNTVTLPIVSIDAISEQHTYSICLQDSNGNGEGEIGITETSQPAISANQINEKIESENSSLILEENSGKITDKIENAGSDCASNGEESNKEVSKKINILQVVISSKTADKGCALLSSLKSSNKGEPILLNKLFPVRVIK